MRKLTLSLLLAVLAVAHSAAQGWTQLPDFPLGVRFGGVGIGIGDKGYVGLGSDDTQVRGDWWQYDPALRVWTQKADYPGGPRVSPIVFAVGDKAYVGTGVLAYTAYNDFYEYNTVTNTWTRKADFEGGLRYGALSFTIGDKGYVGAGKDQGLYDGNNDFWQYDPATDDWIQKASIGPVHRSFGAAFSSGAKGYIGLGVEGYDTRKKDFWEYNSVTDTWVQQPDFPASERYVPHCFTIGGKGYIGMGYNYAPLDDLWEYDPAAGTWTQRESNIPRGQGMSFSIGAKGYAGFGYNSVSSLGDFWEYAAAPPSVTICGQTWMAQNLTVTTYRNGDPIPQVTDPAQWVGLTTGAWCYYNNDPSTEAVYGKLYNWYAVNDPRGLAPQGWHIPDNGEWVALENCAGGYFTAGGALKEAGTAHWLSPNTGATNSTGFTALPGGMRTGGGSFMSLEQVGNWWSASSGQYAHFGILFQGGYYRSIFYASAIFYGNEAYTGFPSYPISDFKTGMSVRCIKDAPPSFTGCPGNPVRYATASGCAVPVVYNATAAGTPAPSLSYSFTGATTGSGSGTGSGQSFNRGVTVVTIQATSTAGTAYCAFTVEIRDTVRPVISCPPAQQRCNNDNNTYSIPPLPASDNCGIRTIAYTITGATQRSGTGADASGQFNAGASTIRWTVTDSSGNTSTCQSAVTVNPKLDVILPNVYSAVLGRPNTIYIGYGITTVVLTPVVSGGTPYSLYGIPYYRYQWSNGSTLPVLLVTHNTPGTYNYSCTITDAKGCSRTVSRSIRVIDVRCTRYVFGIPLQGVLVCRPGNVQKCVFDFAVWAEVLANAEIGPCTVGYTSPFVLNQDAKESSMLSLQRQDQVLKIISPRARKYAAFNAGIDKKSYAAAAGLETAAAEKINAGFEVFPNPGNGVFNVRLGSYSGGSLLIEVSDMSGRIIRRAQVGAGNGWGTIRVDLGRVAQGMYIIKITDGQKITAGKVMVR